MLLVEVFVSVPPLAAETIPTNRKNPIIPVGIFCVVKTSYLVFICHNELSFSYDYNCHQYIPIADICQWLLTIVSNTLNDVNTSSVDHIYTELGKRIVKGRNDKGMSQEKLAANSGIDRSYGVLSSSRVAENQHFLHSFKIAKSLICR